MALTSDPIIVHFQKLRKQSCAQKHNCNRIVDHIGPSTLVRIRSTFKRIMRAFMWSTDAFSRIKDALSKGRCILLRGIPVFKATQIRKYIPKNYPIENITENQNHAPLTPPPGASEKEIRKTSYDRRGGV